MANEGTSVTNSNASTDVPSNYSICARTGFRVLPGRLIKDGYGQWVRPESADQRHPQELVRSRPEKQRGSVSPEGTDTFLADGEVTADDL